MKNRICLNLYYFKINSLKVNPEKFMIPGEKNRFKYNLKVVYVDITVELL